MKIEAWKSEHTGEIFERETDYKKHMRKERAELVREGKRSAELAKINLWLETEKEALTSIDMIAPW